FLSLRGRQWSLDLGGVRQPVNPVLLDGHAVYLALRLEASAPRVVPLEERCLLVLPITFQTSEGHQWAMDEWILSTKAPRGTGWKKTVLVPSSCQPSTVWPGSTYSVRLSLAFFCWFPMVHPRPSNLGTELAADAVAAPRNSNTPPTQVHSTQARFIVL